MSRPAVVAELLEGPHPCCLSTLDDDGSPYVVVVWCAAEGDAVAVNAAEGRWLDNLRRDPRASLVVLDTANILRYVGIDGRAVTIEPDPGHAHMNELSRLYEGRDYAYATPEDERRFKIVIEPARVRAFDLPPPDAPDG
ncbi:MAG: TIGR03618 family F420-dependent PPOX class oxidoreductase [Solirubrobacterales bacterium]